MAEGVNEPDLSNPALYDHGTPHAVFDELCARGHVAGPRTAAEIAEAERELDVVFPQQYRDLLATRGAVVANGCEVYGLPGETSDDPPLWQDVVQVTTQLREQQQAGTEHGAYVPFSDDGTGIYFFFDTAVAPDTRIVAIGPGVERVMSSDLFAFLVDLSAGRVRA